MHNVNYLNNAEHKSPVGTITEQGASNTSFLENFSKTLFPE